MREIFPAFRAGKISVTSKVSYKFYSPVYHSNVVQPKINVHSLMRSPLLLNVDTLEIWINIRDNEAIISKMPKEIPKTTSLIPQYHAKEYAKEKFQRRVFIGCILVIILVSIYLFSVALFLGFWK